jgi:alpha-mannosidase
VRVRTDEDGDVVLENGRLRACLASSGRVTSLLEKRSGREALAGDGNVFELYEDPGDAWDVEPQHLETRKECAPAVKYRVTEENPLRATVEFEHVIGAKSRLVQQVRLEAGARRLEFHTTLEWRENHKMLKVAFPVGVRAMHATYEMQFGCVARPTHYNTPYDLAMYEVPAHKWADLSEHGFGVALLNDCKYGYSTFGNTLRLSLLRSPKSPDPVADMGRHEFSYALFPHAGGWQAAGVVGEAYRFNVPVRWAPGTIKPASWAAVNTADLVLDTIKKAEDSEALVLRLYEAHGARGTARVKVALPFHEAVYCNILEEELGSVPVRDGVLEVPYTPFQLIGVKLK